MYRANNRPHDSQGELWSRPEIVKFRDSDNLICASFDAKIRLATVGPYPTARYAKILLKQEDLFSKHRHSD